MSSTIYRRQSMAQLYEKLRAQDDDDDSAWLAQYSPDDKLDEPYVSVVRPPPALSAISSASPVSSCSSGSFTSDPYFDNESSDDPFDFDSDSDVDPEPLSLDLPSMEFDHDHARSSPLIFQSCDPITVTEPSDPPCFASAHETILSRSPSIPPEDTFDSLPVTTPSPLALPAPSIGSRRTTRTTQKSPTRYGSPIVLHDSNEDVISESDGNGTEDEYIPSPTLGSKKRHGPSRSIHRTAAASSQRRKAGDNKRPRHYPVPRNVQAPPGVTPATPATKNNPWACPYCKWVQRNHRTPDLKRHIRTHTRLQRPAQWVCCGIPIRDAENYHVPADAKAYVWAGEMMIGGCCKEFSRRDALKRHLDNDHINCIGNFSAFASICEDEI